MGMLDWVSKVIGRYEEGANYKLGQSLSSSAISGLMGTGGDAINVIEEYNGFAWKAINIRAKMLSAEDLFVEKLVGKKWQPDELHEFNAVLEGSEGQRDLSELLEAHSKSMDLYGESFWYFSKGERYGRPMGVYLLDPSAMTVFVSGNRVTGYLYQKDGVRETMELDEIIHPKDEDPRSPFRGYGPMQAAGWFIKSNRYLYTYMNNFMENNAIPAGVIVAESADDKDWELFKAQWTNKYSGIDNAGKTGFVRGSNLDFVKTGMSLGDMDFEKLKNSSRDDVMIMFGISKPMMAIFDDINRASATVARQLFGMTFTEPALKSITRKLSKKVAVWYGKQYRVASTNPVPEDDEVRITRLEKGTNRWITINEARIADGLEPLGPEYDVITQAGAPIAPPAAKSVGKVTIRTKNNKAIFSYEMKENYRSEVEELQKKYEQKFLQASNPILKAQKEMVLDQIQPKKVVDAKMNVTEEAKKLEDILLPLFLELAREQGALSINFAGNSSMKFELTPVMEKYIKDSIAKATLGFTEETEAKIATNLVEAINAGESTAKIAKRISGIYDDVLGVKTPGYRIERLSRTEVIKASNEASELAYKQTGVVKKKEWFNNPGACQFCTSISGNVANLGAVFIPKGATIDGADGGTSLNDYEDVKHPPLHPACRCTLIPVVEN